MQNAGPLLQYVTQFNPGWHKLWQAGRQPVRTVRIFEDQEVSQGVLSRSEAVLIPQSLVLNP